MIAYLTASQLKERIQRNDPLVLLDVREDHEVETHSLENIKHIPMGQIVERVEELNPSEEIVCICHLGQRSFYVAQYLLQQGFEKVYNLEGGMASFEQKSGTTL